MERGRFRTILYLALPIMGAMVSQNLLNLVDMAMVGFLGPISIAAIGIGGFATFMANACVLGLASGVQIMAARRKGEGRDNETAVPLSGGLFLALIIGFPVSTVLFFLAPAIFPLLNGDPGVIAEGVPYYSVRVLGVVAMGMNFCFRGFWTAVNRPGIYLRALLFMHACNILISYVLIFGHLGLPALGTLGAGIGTTISVFLGTAVHLFIGWRLARPQGFLQRIPGGETMRTMVRLAIPSTIQQFLFAAGITALFWIIGKLGADSVAAGTVLVNLVLVALLPAMGLGLAGTTLVGQALGRGDAGDAKRWGWDVVKVTMALVGALGIVAIAIPDILLGGFLHDPSVVAIGRGPLQLTGFTIAADAAGMILSYALLGAGAAARVMHVSVATQWAIGLPIAWLAGPYFGLGLLAVWGAFVGYRMLQTAIYAGLWGRGRWASIKV